MTSMLYSVKWPDVETESPNEQFYIIDTVVSDL
jgi:hypothetical protein